MTPEEMEMHIKRLENIILDMHFSMRIPLPGICVNVSCGEYRHPHWTEEPQINWDQPIIYLREGK